MSHINPLRGYTIFSLVLLAILILAAVAASGCASLVPNSVRPELEHQSHLTQHEPFTDHPADNAANFASVALHWDLAQRHAFFEIAEGVNLSPHWQDPDTYGDVMGPRETFTARIGYVFQVRQ